VDRLDVQPALQMAESPASTTPPGAPRYGGLELPRSSSTVLAAGIHNGFTHQGPGLIDLAGNKSGEVSAGLCICGRLHSLLAVAEEAFLANTIRVATSCFF